MTRQRSTKKFIDHGGIYIYRGREESWKVKIIEG